jgi:hypothetical protein
MQELKNCQFGKDYYGTHRVWTAKVGVEAKDVYKKDNDPIWLLLEDFNQAPVIAPLSETAELTHRTFNCAGAAKNIYFIIE